MRGKAFGTSTASQIGLRVVSIVAFFLVWWMGTLLLGPRLCPDPITVLAFAGRELFDIPCERVVQAWQGHNRPIASSPFKRLGPRIQVN